jgi:hypothetical protein
VAISNSTTFLKVPMVIIYVWEPSSLPGGGGVPGLLGDERME